ncbi:replication termination factor [Plasmodium brasilianum]|uniref:Replication termination factor, putative n=2 Tax=Plasmodium (Plasmodium) TaxID=418103 RepID=A0A1D3JN09_PLAMA|nr:replication termination factor, putative [Plasmodium malariae]KAI4839497.1 replication termination factor [Plasmodium brasilianum]SBT87922.1 replication termination factor, putative [Plasmodium malariae]
MGGDGGSLPQRVDLVRMKNKKLKENTGSLGYEKNTLVTINHNKYSKKELKEYYFNHCAISQEALKEPFFCCRLGFLYNKENIFKLILFKKQNKKKRKKDFYDKFSHIDSLKDLVLCKSKLNEEKKLICLISNEIINATSGAICLFSCGCVFSKKVFNRVNIAKENICVTCNKKYKPSDIIEIGIDDESVLEEKKKLIKKRKMDKKKDMSHEKKETSDQEKVKKKKEITATNGK